MSDYPELRVVPDPVDRSEVSKLVGCWLSVLVFGIGFWTTILIFISWAIRR